jgi:signal transduction histidine kinase/DNA-binding NarL/FixJ family response regulator
MNSTKAEACGKWAGDLVRDNKMKTLIIDDDPASVALLENVLSDYGYRRVKSITDSRLALDTCKDFEPDLILLDLLMPHVDGFAILTSLRANKREIYLPIVVLTADVNEETKFRALHTGATDFLFKPFDQTEVLLRIRNLFETVRTDRRRAAQYAVASSLAGSSKLVQVSSKILGAIASTDNWNFGVMWLYDEKTEGLRCLTTWYANSDNLSRFAATLSATELVKGRGLAGRAWKSKKPTWAANITLDSTSSYACAAAGVGLHVGFAFPLYVDGTVNGIIELLASDAAEPDEDLFQTVEALGIQIGLFLERGRIEEQLQREKESAQAANAAKDRFLATLSHELRTPLNPVLIWAGGTLQQPDLTPDLREGLEMVCRNVELEARLIDDMLDLTRITRGKLKLELHPTDAHGVLLYAIDIVRSDIERDHLNISMALEASNHGVLADMTRLHQVFWNVLRNSCKFARESGLISVRSYNPNPNTITIEISDNGTGIEPQYLKRIFDAFEQVDSRREGVGLGLAISKSIVEMHNGTIHASSAGLGKGSTFVINLPTSVSLN